MSAWFLKGDEKIEWYVDGKPEMAGKYLCVAVHFKPTPGMEYRYSAPMVDKFFIPFGSLGDPDAYAFGAVQLMGKRGLPVDRFQHTLRYLTFGGQVHAGPY